MAQHGYLGDDYGSEFDPDYVADDDRERGWRGSEQRGNWRGDDDRRFMFERGSRSDADEWFGGRSGGQRSATSRFGQPSAHPDDHYRSWRDKQVQAMDREYADYCREREQQFHSDFDSWRQKRQQSQQQLGLQGVSSGETMELTNPTSLSGETQATENPLGDATLGTNNPENSTTGRRGR